MLVNMIKILIERLGSCYDIGPRAGKFMAEKLYQKEKKPFDLKKFNTTNADYITGKRKI